MQSFALLWKKGFESASEEGSELGAHKNKEQAGKRRRYRVC